MTVEDQTLFEQLRARAAQDPGGIYARYDGAPITFGDLARHASSLAAALRARGLGKGSRVAVMMRNSPEALAVIFALAREGMAWVPLNAQQRGEGLRYILEHSAPGLVIADAEHLMAIGACGAGIEPERLVVHGASDGHAPLQPLLEGEAGAGVSPPRAGDLFAIMYTSGTTGRPKGVLVTHRMMQRAGEAAGLVAGAEPGDVFLVWEPLYHIGGAQLLGLPMTHGIALAMIGRFSAANFWSETRRYGATHIHFLGGILQMLLKQPPGPLDRSHGARIAWGGGCPPDVWTPFQERFGVAIRECYGMTESSSITTFNVEGVVGSVGRPVPWLDVELRLDGRTIARPGERGEIVVRTKDPGAVFAGYLDHPEATAKALRDGAFYTGDLGSWDAGGRLVFHGRMTDSVRCRGENVSAWEVEHVAAKHPAVEHCAMIGVAAEIGEQEIKLFVKPKPGAQVDPAEMSAWLAPRLAAYQNPRYIKVIDEFERTPSQRIMKHKLSARRDDCWDRLAQQGR